MRALSVKRKLPGLGGNDVANPTFRRVASQPIAAASTTEAQVQG
jgi:hypothetical protein